MQYARKCLMSGSSLTNKIESTCITDIGPGPLGKKCRECINVRGTKYKNYEIFICDISGEQIILNGRACSWFEQRDEAIA